MENQEFTKLLQDLKEGGFIYNDSDFCRKMGIGTGRLSMYKSGKRGISERFVNDIKDRFPAFFNPKTATTIPIETDAARLLRIIEDHDIRFHELANRILDGMGVPRVKKEAAVS